MTHDPSDAASNVRDPPPSPPRRVPTLSALQWIVLIGVFAAGAFLRFHGIAKSNLWLDEIWSVEMSIGRDSVHDHLPLGVVELSPIDMTNLDGAPPWWAIWTHMNGQDYPPLYFIALRQWTDVFGNGTAAVRCLSAAFSVAGLLVFFDLCRMLFRPNAALLATALMAVAVGQIDFAQSPRAYAMLIFLALGCGNVLLRIERLGVTNRRIACLAALLYLTIMTHYYAAGALMALAVYAVLRLRGPTRRRVLAAFVVAFLLFAATWGYGFVLQQRQYAAAGPSWQMQIHRPTLSVFFVNVAILPTKYLLSDQYFQALDIWFMCLIGALTCAIPLALLAAGRKNLLFWILWVYGTIGLVAAVSLIQHSLDIGLTRYTILASPGVYALVAGYDWPNRPLLRHLAAIVAVAFVARWAVLRTTAGIPDIGDMHKMATLLDANVAPDELVLFYSHNTGASPGSWYLGWRYYSPDAHHSQPWMALTAPPDNQVNAQLERFNSLWLVGPSAANGMPPDYGTILPAWILASPPIECSAGCMIHLVHR